MMGCHLMKPAPWQILSVRPGLCCVLPRLGGHKTPKGGAFLALCWRVPVPQAPALMDPVGTSAGMLRSTVPSSRR